MNMSRKAFAAEVANGKLRFRESLADLEGQRVLVTLGLYPQQDASDERLPLSPDPQPSNGLDIERDVNFRMPFRWETVTASVGDAGSLRPCLILPEESADE
jgi:hypothetical protein